MLALSIRQPWSWLIVNGYKDIENRAWSTAYRGPLLIHTGKSPVLAEDIAWLHAEFPQIQLPSVFEYGGIIGQAELVACVELHMSDWFFGPVGWVLCNPKPLPFQPCRGKLGLFQPGLTMRSS
jgi:hypothetical protein